MHDNLGIIAVPDEFTKTRLDGRVRSLLEDGLVAARGPANADGTPLEGTQVTGLLADVVPFLSVLRPQSEFYDHVSRNLEDVVTQMPGVPGDDWGSGR